MLYTIKVFYVSNKTLMLPNDKEKICDYFS